MSGAARQAAKQASAWRKWYAPEVVPIFVITGVAVAGAGAYLWKLSQGPEVVWNRRGDWAPWDKVRYDQNLKLITINPEFWEQRKKEYLQQQAAAASADGNRLVDKI